MPNSTNESLQTKTPEIQSAANMEITSQPAPRQLAEEQQITRRWPNPPDLIGRLKQQEAFLKEAHQIILKNRGNEEEQETVLSYAAEWLLDNFYIILRTIREIRKDMPGQYYRQLPKLSNTEMQGYPRIYTIALHIIRARNARLEIPQLQSFLEAYQEVKPLTVGEIWAAPTMLRFCIVEALTQAVSEVVAKPIPLRSYNAFAIPAGIQPDVLIANGVTSLRLLDAHNWKDFFDNVSLVERTLNRDPLDVYRQMDFETRDRYRKAVEELAFQSEETEIAVAAAAVKLAENSPEGEDLSPRHVGYFLIGRGYPELEQAIRFTPPRYSRVKRWFLQHPTFTYLGSVTFLIAVLLVILLIYAARNGASAAGLIAIGFLLLVPAWTIAVSLVNWLVTKLLQPKLLPKMDFSEGIPDEFQTMVVVPTLLSSAGEVENLLRQLELHFLQNQGRNLHFALLTDFLDAPSEHMPGDEALLEQAREGIRKLNEDYSGYPSSFFFFHRRRLWNPKMDLWMGWERKRGKIEEFNRLLLGNGPTSFNVQDGNLAVLPQIRFVITLDTDTVLPRGRANRLIGCLAHPLNRPQFDPKTGWVTSGYTILQPRTEVKPTSANISLFTRIFSSGVGLDLYTHAVSDLYQDLFGEGIYVGKGIYDVAAFTRSLPDPMPEDALLSHDLFEGIQGRVALVSDVVLYEDYPPGYLAYIRRALRWIRGDWQLLPWLLPGNPNWPGKSKFSLIDRWKLLDNLQRSLLQPSLLLLLLATWFWLPGSPYLWIAFAVAAPGMPFFTNLLKVLLQTVNGSPGAARQVAVRSEFFRWLLSIAFMPYEALTAIVAIITTLYRVLISHRDLLRWTTAAHVARIFGEEEGRQGLNWQQMSSALLTSLALALALLLFNRPMLWIALPFLALWLASPEIAFWISSPTARRAYEPSEREIRLLRRLARRTWLFFERFVGPEDHWLPPDHFQENPKGVVAHRTSPTNIGLMLASTLAAYDMGYIGLPDLALRLQSSFDTLSRLEQYRGHFLNWYDTRTLAPLPARYVSTVDSGNLIASLIVVKEGCNEVLDIPVLRWERWEGWFDTVAILEEVLASIEIPDPQKVKSICAHLRRLEDQVLAQKDAPHQWAALIDHIMDKEMPSIESGLLDLIQSAATELDITTMQSIRTWSERTRYQLSNLKRGILTLIPWLFAFAQAPALFTGAAADAPLAAAWHSLRASLPIDVTISDAPGACDTAQQRLSALLQALDHSGAPSEEVSEARKWCQQLDQHLPNARNMAKNVLSSLQSIIDQSEAIIAGTDFNFLYNPRREIFRIGYNVDTGSRDPNYYDLLASEARISSLLAIGQGEVPQSHWVHLGRPLTSVQDRLALLSWNGSIFEYLMPNLFAPQYDSTLLTQTNYLAVRRQIDYARSKGVPWGISESGYYRFDGNRNYQYRAFGAPGLGLKRGLDEDLVITPYASLLALPIEPEEVIKNIHAMTNLNLLQDYGFYEAVDFTRQRLPLGRQQMIVRSFMAHHQGMIFLSLQNFLKDRKTIRRFLADAHMQSIELLLQEQIPLFGPVELLPGEEEEARPQAPVKVLAAPWQVPIDTPFPQAHFLSNGQMGTMITNSGAGFLRWKDLDLTRWRADSTRDSWGLWVYLRDEDSGELWSIGEQPTLTPAQHQEVHFSPHMATFIRTSHDITAHMDLTITSDDDVEIRTVRLTNRSNRPRAIRIASYAEVILATQEADQRHPEFNELFIESHFQPQINALWFHRRQRTPQETPIAVAHSLIVDGPEQGEILYESDRRKFIGRGRSVHAPKAMELANPWLENVSGTGLNPVMSVGKIVQLPPNATVQLAFLTAASETHQGVLALIRKYRNWGMISHSFDIARAHSEMEMRQMGLSLQELQDIQRLFSLVIYPQPILRATPEVLSQNQQGQPALWPYGISGDHPILLVRINSEEQLPLVRELLAGHTYWRSRNLKIDLVILNEKESSYSQEMLGQLQRLLIRTGNDIYLNHPGGIFVLRMDQVAEPEHNILLSAARAILDGERGSLSEQLQSVFDLTARLPAFIPVGVAEEEREPTQPVPRPRNLMFDNGWGGFSPDGEEYIVYLEPGKWTPAPWANVIANPHVGFFVTEAGSGYSWSANSGENRLTPWSNNPISDEPGEALYLRDEETGEIWTPTLLPAGEAAPYLVRHGMGYTTFEHYSHGLKQLLHLSVAIDEPVKIVHLRLENTWKRARRITATYYLEWVLGVNRDKMQMYVVPEYDNSLHTLLARNPYSPEFAGRIAFLAASQEPHGLTTDRTEFLGRRRSMARPAALERIGLSGSVRAGHDPCAAMMLHVDLQPGEVKELYFILGQGEDYADVYRLVNFFHNPEIVQDARKTVASLWEHVLESVQVDTPDPAMNLMLNRWLLYQNLSCRMWGRSAFYQSSGAFGFRDQLQDVMALLLTVPEIAREHILRAAAHQFEAGDALHWWHPPSGRGVRTRISDDLLWLPYVTAEYVKTTGDTGILKEEIPFLRGESLKAGEDERYDLFDTTDETYSLYEHCLRAIKKGSTAGIHGLPLIGAGDWNDGMNRVGNQGRGESIWLGWFLYAVLVNFAPLCEQYGDPQQAGAYRRQAQELSQVLNQHGWDEDWFLRAFYDDGSMVGAKGNLECEIDSIAQSWAVLSGAGEPEKSRSGMQAVDRYLVEEGDGLILLFTPPFDKTPEDPGYIKAYPPGVRENGGQYTHASTWSVWALAEMGLGDRAGQLYHLLNPIYRADTPEKAARYAVEPYVIAADIYSAPPYTGRGGWTWYTGSAGWYYRLGLEAILGFSRQGNALHINPCIPAGWPGFEIVYRKGLIRYRFRIENPDGVSQGVAKIFMDGQELADAQIPLLEDGQSHLVLVRMGNHKK